MATATKKRFIAIGSKGLTGYENYTNIEDALMKGREVLRKHGEVTVWEAVKTMEIVNGKVVIKEI